MPSLIIDLQVDRVDLVGEGANSEAHIKLYKSKRKEFSMDYNEIISKMSPEQQLVIQNEVAKAKKEADEAIAKAKKEADEDIIKAKNEAEVAKKEAEAAKKEIETVKGCSRPSRPSRPSEEEIMKALDPAVQEIFKSIKAQKEAAENVVRQLNEQKIHDEAISKARDLKALPVEQDKLVELVKGIKPEVYELLKTANDSLVNSGLFNEVGKSKSNTTGSSDAWALIEKKAKDIESRDKVSSQKAIATAIKENPELYRNYVSGGAN